MVTSPLIAWWTKGKYYLARKQESAATQGSYLRLQPASV